MKGFVFLCRFQPRAVYRQASREILGNNERWTIFGLALSFPLPILLRRWKRRSVRKYLGWETVCVLVSVFIPATVILFFQCGRASMLPPMPGMGAESLGAARKP